MQSLSPAHALKKSMFAQEEPTGELTAFEVIVDFSANISFNCKLHVSPETLELLLMKMCGEGLS